MRCYCVLLGAPREGTGGSLHAVLSHIAGHGQAGVGAARWGEGTKGGARGELGHGLEVQRWRKMIPHERIRTARNEWMRSLSAVEDGASRDVRYFKCPSVRSIALPKKLFSMFIMSFKIRYMALILVFKGAKIDAGPIMFTCTATSEKYAKAVLVLAALKCIFWNICKDEKAHAEKHGILFIFLMSTISLIYF
jgi:hypothetical protein